MAEFWNPTTSSSAWRPWTWSSPPTTAGSWTVRCSRRRWRSGREDMDERVWRLPGPRSFVRDIVAEHGRGRHVATVLPEALASDVQFTDSLSVALLEEFAGQTVTARRIYDAGPGASVL